MNVFIILSLLLFNPSYAKYGSGPLKLDKSTIGSMIGPGGKVIQEMQKEKTIL